MSLVETPTVAGLATYGLRELHRLRRSDACLRDCEAQFRLRLVATFARRKADELEHAEVVDAARDWADRDGCSAARKTVKRAQWLWKLGGRRGLIPPANPWYGVELPKAPRKLRFASRAEREALQSYAEPVVMRGVRSRFSTPPLGVILTLAETPALRVQECAALTRREVDLPAGLVRSRNHKARATRDVKLIAVSPYQAAVFRRLDSLWGAGRRYVFPSPTGGDKPVHEICKSLKRLCRHIGIRHLSPHDLRRGCAQEALDREV